MAGQSIQSFLNILDECLKSYGDGDRPSKSCVYVPEGANVNYSNDALEIPTTEYNDREKRYDVGSVKVLVGGIYGRS